MNRKLVVFVVVSAMGFSSIGFADGLLTPVTPISVSPPSESSAPIASPEPSASPAPVVSPQPSSSPNPVSTPEPSASPVPSEPPLVISPAPSMSPEPTAIPDPPGAIGLSDVLEKQTYTNTAGLSVTQIRVDDTKANEILTSNSDQVVTIPIQSNTDVVIGELNGQTIKSMDTNNAILEIKNEVASYTLPASLINIDTVSQTIGQQVALKDINVAISIAPPSENIVNIVENTASKNNYQVVVKPIEFSITCTSGNTTLDVSRFNGYVERTVAIPQGVDPTKISTGIVLNQDGTFSHVPTKIVLVEGKYYAKINSLTNSVYAVLSSNVTFADMTNHWAKTTVEELGSKLIVSGKGEGRFVPDASVTRAEFATMVTKALGIYRTKVGKALFKDVPVGSPFVDAVTVASEYGLIQGDPSGAFRPNARITRQEAMVVLSRAMAYAKVLTTKGVALEQFKDAGTVASWAKDSATELVSKGIMGGSNGLLRPTADVSRAEVAALLSRILKAAGLV